MFHAWGAGSRREAGWLDAGTRLCGPKMISAVTQSHAMIFETPAMCSLSTTAVRSTTAIDALASNHAAR